MDRDFVCVERCGEDGRRKILRLTRGKSRWVDGDCLCMEGCGEDGGRKILRLYKADAVGMEGWDMGDDK